MLSVVIPVFNRKEFTRACLKALLLQTEHADQIIIINDGSSDGTAAMLAEEFPEVIVIHGDGNLFWTASINKGIRSALSSGTDYVITLNNDTVPADDFIEKMMMHAKTNPESLLGALDIDIVTKQPYYGGEIFNWTKGSSKFLLNTLAITEQNGIHEVSLFPARGLLIPRAVFEKVGLFEEKRLPHYMADYDFTLLARKNGFKVYCNYDARLYTYPEEGGDHKIRRRKTLGNYFSHLFGIRGGGNLKNFTIYALRNCPPQKLLLALTVGYARRLTGFWIN